MTHPARFDDDTDQPFVSIDRSCATSFPRVPLDAVMIEAAPIEDDGRRFAPQLLQTSAGPFRFAEIPVNERPHEATEREQATDEERLLDRLREREDTLRRQQERTREGHDTIAEAACHRPPGKLPVREPFAP